jgi:KTSC domain
VSVPGLRYPTETNMVKVNSSAIRAVDYNPRSLELQVAFTSGRLYTYYGVPPWKYASLINASSVGTYFNDNIRDQHSVNRG